MPNVSPVSFPTIYKGGKVFLLARHIYVFMVWKTRYIAWITREINELSLQKGKDYFIKKERRAGGFLGGKRRLEFYITPTAVSEIAMRHFSNKKRREKCRSLLSFVQTLIKSH